MATLVEQLKTEIKNKQGELKALEAALAALTGAPKASKRGGGGGVRKPRTEEQKAAQAARMREYHAAKKAGKAPAKKSASKAMKDSQSPV